MKRDHIAFIALQGNGHLYPILPLCSELVARGYRVTCVATEHYANAIRNAGAETIPFTDTALTGDFLDDLNRRFHDEPRSVHDPVIWEMTRAYRTYHHTCITDLLKVRRHYQEDPPLCVVCDRNYHAGRVLAAYIGAPIIHMSPTFAYYKHLIYRENGVCCTPDAAQEFSRELDLTVTSYGVECRDSLWAIADWNIHFMPKAFQFGNEWFDRRFFFAGSHLNRKFTPSWSDRSDGRPIVMISGISGLPGMRLDGTASFKAFIDALSTEDCYCVLSIGENVTTETLGALPPNFEINQRASHLEILPHAALSVSHGGTGTCLEALYHGIPVLAIPANLGCEEVAYRVTEMGLGVCLPRDGITGDTVRNAVLAMLQDGALKKRVSENRAVFEGSGSSVKTADAVERHLGREPTVAR